MTFLGARCSFSSLCGALPFWIDKRNAAAADYKQLTGEDLPVE